MPIPVESAVHEIIAVGRRLDARGLAAATSGNYSQRVSDDRIAITASGSHKGRLCDADVMLVDSEGRSLDHRIPSAETPLHVQLYRVYPHVHAVLHVHSVAAVALTRSRPKATSLALEGYEMLRHCLVSLPMKLGSTSRFSITHRTPRRWRAPLQLDSRPKRHRLPI
jgi:methylthioribulose-1-phosphate dehydratase